MKLKFILVSGAIAIIISGLLLRPLLAVPKVLGKLNPEEIASIQKVISKDIRRGGPLGYRPALSWPMLRRWPGWANSWAGTLSRAREIRVLADDWVQVRIGSVFGDLLLRGSTRPSTKGRRLGVRLVGV